MLNEYIFIGFYRTEEEYGCFSNWYPSEFEYAGIKYSNSEQYMMYQKMCAFGAYEIADKILSTTDPAECKQLGRAPISNWDSDYWDRICYPIMKRGIRAKFVQDEKLYRKLRGTVNALIAECSPSDTKWGIGIDVEDPRRFDIHEWRGKNLLGRILMEVRDELKPIEHIGQGKRYPEYRDARNLGAIEEWEMTIGELMRIPKYRKIVSDYVEIVGKFCGDSALSRVVDYSPARIEDMQRNNMGGGLPPQGFWEMKQDFYETVNFMWVLASGFDAPAYGYRIPDDAKVVVGEDGKRRIVYPEE